MCMYECICIYVLFVCNFVCMYIHTYIHVYVNVRQFSVPSNVLIYMDRPMYTHTYPHIRRMSTYVCAHILVPLTFNLESHPQYAHLYYANGTPE